MSESRIIVALDVATAEDAVRLAKRVAPHVGAFKIGLSASPCLQTPSSMTFRRK